MCCSSVCRRLRLPGMYHVVARYGYMEAVDHGPAFISAVVQVGVHVASGCAAHLHAGLAWRTAWLYGGCWSSARHLPLASLSTEGCRHFPLSRRSMSTSTP